MNKDFILTCTDVTKTYDEGPQPVEVLKGVNFQLAKSQRVAIVGTSGSGKSTLLNVLGGLDTATSGNVVVDGKSFAKLNENQRGRVRNQTMGFVYQFHHLLPEFTAQENVMMPLLIAGRDKKTANILALSCLEKVGLDARSHHKPSELSGGERQRVAIARALVNDPACVLMDEPTGNLDKGNASAIQALMSELSESLSTSFVVVTHDEHMAFTMDTVYELSDGILVEKTAP
ncbi:MAG: lipoprotein-releasing ABC transporter ATP-binding protein LolD [Agarilytica sp.]